MHQPRFTKASAPRAMKNEDLTDSVMSQIHDNTAGLAAESEIKDRVTGVIEGQGEATLMDPDAFDGAIGETIDELVQKFPEHVDFIVSTAEKAWADAVDALERPADESKKETSKKCDDGDCDGKSKTIEDSKAETFAMALEALKGRIASITKECYDSNVIFSEDCEESVMAVDAALSAICESTQNLCDALKGLRAMLPSYKNEDNMNIVKILADAIQQVAADELGEDGAPGEDPINDDDHTSDLASDVDNIYDGEGSEPASVGGDSGEGEPA